MDLRFRLLSIAVLSLIALPLVSFVSEADLRAQDKAAVDKQDSGDEVLASALENLLFGRERAAKREIRELEKIEGFGHEALWLKSELDIRFGDPNDAVKALQKGGALESKNPWLLNALCEAHYQSGNSVLYDDAATRYLKDFPASAAANFQKGRTLFVKGDKLAEDFFALAQKVARQTSKEVKGVLKQFAVAEAYYYAGLSSFLMDQVKAANEFWYDAIDVYEYHEMATVMIGRNFLESSEMDRTALENYAEKVLTFNAKSVPALLLFADAHAFRGAALEQRKFLDRAIVTNRDSAPARLARANYLIGNANYAAAETDLKRAEKINENGQEYLATRAYWLIAQGKTNDYETLEAKLNKATADPGLFYLHVGKGLQRRFRPAEAQQVFKRGIERSPRLWRLYREMGWTLLSLGMTKEALPYLRTALKEDTIRNKIDTQNVILLFEKYYEDLDTHEILGGAIRLTIMKQGQELLIPYYEREFGAAMEQISQKYGSYQLDTPLIVDVLPSAETFSVRTAGIPGIAASGVCFGKLINLAGPKAFGSDGYNWASTLVHELDHAFQLQISNGQIPRWLAEGSSVFQESLSRPQWQRHMEEELFRVFSAGDLPSVVTFDEWFRDSQRVLFAYYLGGVMVDYILKNHGTFETITRMMREFAAYLPLE
ncbi:MAG: hypothetical protein KDB07_10235, partial [Planctomycetes bacterium]|nr:hypothetical protein [Planctomycetota bacterium]